MWIGEEIDKLKDVAKDLFSLYVIIVYSMIIWENEYIVYEIKIKLN